jgi:hypothetical protein
LFMSDEDSTSDHQGKSFIRKLVGLSDEENPTSDDAAKAIRNLEQILFVSRPDPTLWGARPLLILARLFFAPLRLLLRSKMLKTEAPKGFLIDLLVPPDRADDMLLGLQTAFEERWVPKYGARCARRMFMTHSIGSIIGFWINWMMKHLRLLKFFASGGG